MPKPIYRTTVKHLHSPIYRDSPEARLYVLLQECHRLAVEIDSKAIQTAVAEAAWDLGNTPSGV